MKSFARGDICDSGRVVPGASGQGSVVGGPLQIEYPVLVDVKVDSFWRGRLKSCDNLAQARVFTELTNLALMLLASRYPKCTLFPVRSQRPDGERRHVSQLTTI